MTAANAYQGEVLVKIGDRNVRLRIDYDTIGRLMTHIGGKDWIANIGKAFDDYDMTTVCQVIEMMADGEDVSAQEIYDASPPIMHLYQASEAAINVSLIGHPNELENMETDPVQSAEEAGKPDPLSTPKTRWRDQGASLLNRVFGRTNFGT